MTNIFFTGREYELMVLSEDPHGEALFSKSLRITTLGFDNQHPTVMQNYSPMGPPLNVTIQYLDSGYLVSWSPPEYGVEYLHQYVLKWFDSLSSSMQGLFETTNTSCLGKL